jgi:hypothetical protein
MVLILQGPDYTNRTPDQIIGRDVFFDSVGYIYRSLSWIDIAKRERSVCALQYAAHDARQAFEQLLFEEIVFSVGTKLDCDEYQKCKGSSTKLNKIIYRLNPEYQKLVSFTQAVVSADPELLPIVVWDHKYIMKLWGKVSNYLHWSGEPAETVESIEWLNKGIVTVEAAAQYIWKMNLTGYTAIMMPQTMQPDIRHCWERYRTGEIDTEAVKRIAELVLPVLCSRTVVQRQR